MSLDDSALTERLERLVESGFGPSDTSEYMKSLKELADQIARARVDIKRMSRVFRALSHPTRLKTMRLLKNREMCVCEIMAVLRTTQPTTSHHLNILESVGLVKERHEGKWIFYSLSGSELAQDLINLILTNH